MIMRIDGINFVKQKDHNFCGPALASMALSKFGKNVSQEEIGNIIMKINPSNGLENSFTHDVCGYISKHGVYSTYYNNFPKNDAFNMLLENIKKGNPVFISQKYSKSKPIPHARLAIGFYPNEGEVKFIECNDPLDGQNQKIKVSEFLELWDSKNSPMMNSSNEMIVFQKEKPNFNSDCPICKRKMVTTKVDFYNNPSEFKYSNPITVEWSGIQGHCSSCNVNTAVFS